MPFSFIKLYSLFIERYQKSNLFITFLYNLSSVVLIRGSSLVSTKQAIKILARFCFALGN
jgi:hypothetical protein